MSVEKKAKGALISVYYKDGLEPIVKELHNHGVTLYSTGGTQKFIEDLGIPVVPVEDLTGYPSIFGGRVKTLHPKIFGGILHRREHSGDQKEAAQYEIPEIDIVIVDLYPFEETVASGASPSDIIEKIDIGGISLIRGAAKNFADVLIVPSVKYYDEFLEILQKQNGSTSLEQRRLFATRAFEVSSHYDSAIFNYFNQDGAVHALKVSESEATVLRYGENPHQKGMFFGDLSKMLQQLHGKELSDNNLLDVDAALNLIREFDDPTVAIIKHNNACGLASREDLLTAWKDALAGDPVSAFGGIIAINRNIDKATADEINNIFCEVVMAPSYDEDALEILKSKKNRIILTIKDLTPQHWNVRTALNGILVQERDHVTDSIPTMKPVTDAQPTQEQLEDLAFASKICKHTKSNTIVLAKGKQLLASGTGQTSRVDALRQAIAKAKGFEFDLKGAVMASDAFFPFPDCVEIAHEEGIDTVIQPGGSIKDQLSIDYCNENKMAMVFTGTRHFKH
ncbi:MAG: bifunctional phosphoribosylaminoimidazolecarboxamide formyltransferase/IMP cyclohydrolase [Bacteroidota bacterium]|nr:bifunctional phosphoribosylaminoimidazolecarboxamide formyltransferase/IMP cyclohydrolase [Bacteroidota bacterium]MDX5506525.1 bifunctional phosphoribosylaminoimidazolecarboxamide formyltransferase/IMP cyclohydrolase [Bacteroidota bacterium]